MKITSKSYLFILLTSIFLFSVSIVSPALADGSELVTVLTLSSTGHDRANSIAFSSDGKIMAVGGSSGIYLFDTDTLANPGFIPANTWTRSLAFLPGGDTLAGGLFDDTIKFWQAGSGQLLNTFTGHQGWVRSISLSADGTRLASVSDDDSVRIWDVVTQSQVLIITVNALGGRAVALSPDGSMVAVALQDNTVRVWSTADGSLLHTFEGHTSWVRCLAFSSDGQTLASGSFDTTIHLWDLSAGRVVRELEGHTSSVLALAFSPDGQTLASGSVDQSVRIWQVGDGTQLRALRGHRDFVYTVAYSPDGKRLASGGGDNTVRVWNLDKILSADSISELGGEPGHQNNGSDCAMCHQETSSDCRTCHHPGGTTIPPRVIEVRCEVCHANGVSLKWCPVFPRSVGATTKIENYSGAMLAAGVPVSGKNIMVLLSSPSNGETLYTKQAYMAPAVVTGQVFSARESVEGVQVQLDIWSGETLINTLTTKPRQDGDFSFNLVLNESGNLPISTKPSARDCNQCHDDYIYEGELPPGNVRLVVTASTADGDAATDERWVIVDVSTPVTLLVEVTDTASAQPIGGIVVRAESFLYEWKAQYARETSQSDGHVDLIVDKLSAARSTYTFTVEPTVINGVRYASDTPVEMVLEPGVENYSPIQLTVRTDGGSISGDVSGAAMENLELLAFNLPNGPLYQAESDAGGHFAFDVLPVSKYVVLADALILAQNNLSAAPQNVDLLEQPQAALSFTAQTVPALLGDVANDENGPLPFAWLTIGDGAVAQPVSPATGRFTLDISSSSSLLLTASAPGYYSRAKWIDSLSEPVNFRLKPRPDTQIVPWGEGRIVIPDETAATLSENTLTLEQGWVWGEGGPDRLTLRLSAGQVEIRAGKFALESTSAGVPWLYLYAGSATVTISDGAATTVEAGQMMALAAGAVPVAMNDTIALFLHPALAKLPVESLIEPTLSAKIEDWLSRAGVGAAQAATMVIYSLVLVALVAMPVVAVVSSMRNRSKIKNSQEKQNE